MATARKYRASHRAAAPDSPGGESARPLPSGKLPYVPSERLMMGSALLATLLVFLKASSNGFAFDDEDMLIGNRSIQQWSFLLKAITHDLWWFRDPAHLPVTSRYRPLAGIWFGLNYHLLGVNPAAWHAATIGLYLISVWLLFRIAARLTRDPGTAFAAAILFGLLPIHAQAAAWASAIPLLLCGTLELGSFYVLIGGQTPSRARWSIALVLYAGALLSHESAVVFPVLIAVYAVLLEGRSRPAPGAQTLRDAAVRSAPFFVEVLIYLLIRRRVLGFFINGPSLASADGARILMTIPRVLLTDLSLLVLPSTTGFTHRQLFVANPLSPNFVARLRSVEFAGPLIVLIALAMAFAWILRASANRRLYVFCAAWMGIGIAPMMNLGQIFPDLLIQDDYLFFVSAPWCLMAASLAAAAGRSSSIARRWLMAGAVAVLALYAAAAWRAQGFWHDDVSLFTRCVAEFPESATCHRELGARLKQARDLNGAERELSIAATLAPDDYRTLDELAKTEALLGRADEASEQMAHALRLKPDSGPDDYALLAQLYDLGGHRAQSEAVLRYAASLPGGLLIAGLTRAKLKIADGDGAGAEEVLRALSASYPNDYHVWTLMGSALAAQNRRTEALAAFDHALELSPPDPAPHFFAAQLLHAMDRDREALEQCRLALSIAPDDGNARALMAELTHAGERR